LLQYFEFNQEVMVEKGQIFLYASSLTRRPANSTPVILPMTGFSISPSTILPTAYSSAKIAVPYSTTQNLVSLLPSNFE
jgi:hypothetical protein